jgi:hypothetical protein
VDIGVGVGGSTNDPAGTGGFGGTGPSGSAGAGGTSSGKAGDPSFDAGSSMGCNRDCPTGPCRVVGGVPQTLVTSPFEQQIVALAPGAQDLYYGTLSNSALPPSNGHNGEVRRIPLGGGASTLLVSGVQATDLLLDGDSLYYVDRADGNGNDTLWALPISGGTPRRLAADQRIVNIRVDASSIYFQASVASGVGRVIRVPRVSIDTGIYEVVAETLHPWGFAIDDVNVYWTRYENGGTLFRRPLAGGMTATLVTSNEAITQPMVAGDHVYYLTGGTPGVCQGAVMRVPKTGGMVEQFSPGNTGAASSLGSFVADDDFVYWSQAWYASDRLLRGLKRGDSAGPQIVGGEQLGLGRVAVTATHIYWTARSSSSGPYEIRAMAK